ncbi:KR domain-containing protein [Annulohypoxylon stygium]|nr:KR domain-containing protein [Annulohypoxylon stygium]
MKGMWRSVATENVLLKIVMIEVDRGHLSSLSRTADLISRKFIELRASSPNDSIDLDYVLQDGALYIERFLPDEILNEQFRLRHGPVEDFEESSVEGQGALRANYKQPGLLSSLYFSLDPAFSTPIQNDWVEIKTQAIGLNMKDLVVATAKFDWNYLSTEAAGVVSQVGSTVTSWKVGDRVFGFIPGNMGNYVRSPATLVSKIPEGESFARAASMPVAYLTAIYALKHLAKLSEGESVLIQSATGGLGMAAMRIAKSLGAKIYATVGSDVKRKKLIEEFDIPASQIFHSRDPKTADEIMRATGENGVDVILSNAGGDHMDETLRCTAPLGRFIDVGRTDVIGKGKLSMEVFRRNATLSSFDMGLIYRQKPSLVESLANWMVERGARHLIFLSRSGTGRPNSTLFLDELARFGAKTEIIQCNVTDRDALTSTIERVSNKTLIKGVVHAAMVEGDAFFDKANYSQIHRVLAPKVAGTINLHRATQHLPLDFFLMTSSFIASVGIAAQSAYSAANAFQDAFARFRVSQNLPAISLAIGTVLDVGIISENVNFKQMLLRNGSYGLSETEFLQMLEGALCQPSLPPKHVPELHKLDPCSSGQILLSFEPSRLIPYAAENRINDLVWYNNARFQAIRQSISDRMQEHTTKDSVEEKTSIVREAIVERLAKLLSIAVDELNADKPLSQYGLDSLVAAELRSWLTKTLGVDITLLDLLSKGKSITDLITTVTEQRH